MQSIYKHLTVLMIFGFLTVGKIYSDAPVPLLPEDGSDCVDNEVTLVWNDVTGIAVYSVEIAYDAAFTEIIKTANDISDTTYTVILANDNTYYWRAVTNYQGSPPEPGVSASFTTRKAASLLDSPADEEQCIFGNTVFSWIGDADSYRFMLSEDEDFATAIIDTQGVVTDTLAVEIDKYGKTYYWRIAGLYDDCFSDWSPVNEFRTPGTAPEPVLPEYGSIGIPLFENAPPFDLTLVWRDPDTVDTYKVEISELPDFSELVYENTFDADTKYDGMVNSRFVDLQDLPLELNSQYYWRVAAVEAGCESEVSEYFTFLTPFGQITGINPANNDNCNSLEETFIWTQDNEAMSYRLQVFRDEALSDTLHDIPGIMDTVITDVALDAPLHTYYWRVRASDGNNAGLWSPVKHFTTTEKAPDVIAPEKEVTGLRSEVEIIWNRLPEDTYRLQISYDSGFDSLLVDTSGYADTNFVFNADLHNFTYYYRVNATHGVCTGKWSEVRTFKTAVDKPILISPENDETDVSIPPVFKWEEVDGAEFYTLEIAQNVSFTKDYNVASYLEDNSAMLGIENFPEKTTIWWRVKAFNSEGESLWSEVRRFTTGITPPDVPEWRSPEHQATKIELDEPVSWGYVESAEQYRLIVSENLYFDDDFFETTTDTNSIVVPEMKNYTKYYCKVRSENSAGSSIWSSVLSFRTIDAPYTEGPILRTPEDESKDVAVEPRLRWDRMSRAEVYKVQVSENEDMSNPKIDEETLLNNFFPTGLKYETTYYWRVNAENENSVGPWSEIYSFTTGEEPVGIEDNEDIHEPKIFPNPVTESAILSFYTKENGVVSVIVKSMNGKTVSKETYSMSRGDHRVEIDASEFSPGAYIYIIRAKGETMNGRFMVR